MPRCCRRSSSIPSRQLIGAQCSGTLVLAKLGLIGDLPACTDLTTKPWVIEAGVRVLDAPFVAHGNVATAGGCLSSQYLAAWMIARGGSIEDMQAAIHYVAPVGEKLGLCGAGDRRGDAIHSPRRRIEGGGAGLIVARRTGRRITAPIATY